MEGKKRERKKERKKEGERREMLQTGRNKILAKLLTTIKMDSPVPDSVRSDQLHTGKRG